jgi:hypothetical protein
MTSGVIALTGGWIGEFVATVGHEHIGQKPLQLLRGY